MADGRADTDERLMLAVRAGDVAKLGSLFDRHHRALHDFFARMTGSRAAADDLVQDVFFRILKYRQNYRDDSRFKAWLFHIARNARVDYFNKHSSESPFPDDGFDLQSHAPLPGRELEKQGMDQAPLRESTGWWPRQLALQAALTIGLLFAGVIIGNQVRPLVNLQSNNEIAALRNEIHEMRETIALSLMQHDSASDRLQGVNWSYQLRMPGDEVLAALLDTLIHDSNVNVRLATVDALRQFGEQAVVRRGVVEAITRQESPMVQIALIDLVVDLREKESAGTLRQLSLDPTINAAVRVRAGTGLARLE